MTNTVLCGSVSYNRIVFRKKENSEVEANADFYFDFCGSERKIPIREFAIPRSIEWQRLLPRRSVNSSYQTLNPLS